MMQFVNYLLATINNMVNAVKTHPVAGMVLAVTVAFILCILGIIVHWLLTGLGLASKILCGYVIGVGTIFLVSCAIAAAIGLVMWALATILRGAQES